MTGPSKGAVDEGHRKRNGIRGMWGQPLLDAMPDPVLVVDRDGTVVAVNVHALRLFGYQEAELVGAPVDSLVPEAVRARHAGHRQSYLEAPLNRQMGETMNLSGLRADGSLFPVDISLAWLDTEDGSFVAATVRDVTDRLADQAARDRLEAELDRDRNEAQAQRSQRLESLGQLAGGVAHEFNNLLAVIVNYASFVSEAVTDEAGRSGGTWEGVRQDVEQIQLAAQRATTLTHQLLAFGRQSAGVPQDLDVNALIIDLERLLRRTIGEHIQLATKLAALLPPIRIDRGKLEQSLVSLAVNARDAMPSGGRLHIETFLDEVDDDVAASHVGLRPGRYVRIRVGDDGVGMTPEVRRHAFEPFFTTKPTGEGAGLGLATVYGMVAQAGGWAQIYSEPGSGTTVSMLLPATDGAVLPAADLAERASVPSGETILLVEDEDSLRIVAERILTRSGYRVVVASSGPAALDIARASEHPVDLLLTDVMMPTMMGKELAERLQEIHPRSGVLFMSGYSHSMLSSRSALKRDDLLVEKPFTEAGMLVKVRAALDAREPVATQD